MMLKLQIVPFQYWCIYSSRGDRCMIFDVDRLSILMDELYPSKADLVLTSPIRVEFQVDHWKFLGHLGNHSSVPRATPFSSFSSLALLGRGASKFLCTEWTFRSIVEGRNGVVKDSEAVLASLLLEFWRRFASSLSSEAASMDDEVSVVKSPIKQVSCFAMLSRMHSSVVKRIVWSSWFCQHRINFYHCISKKTIFEETTCFERG